MVDTFARQRTIIGTTANWTTNDLIIGDGEIAAERLSSGVIKLKVGDGIKKFSELSYVEGQFNLTELDARYIQETEASTVGGTTGAGKVARLDGAGLLDDTMMPMTDLDVRYVQESETSGTGGPAAANKVPRLNGSGQLDNSLINVAGFDVRYVQESETTKVGGIGFENLWPRLSADGMLDNSLLHIGELEDHFVPIADTFQMGGPAAANMWPRLSSDGKLDGTLIRVSLLSYRGQIDSSVQPAPATPLNGDFYMQKYDGVVGPGWGAISGQPIGHGDFLNYSTTQGWQIFDSQIDPDAYLRIDGGVMAGKLVTNDSDAAAAGFRILPGTAPTSPLDGDMWFTSTNFFVQVNGQTRAVMAQGGTGLFADGSAGQPSISFTDDTNTGLFSAAGDSNIIGFAVNALEQARIAGNGLGLGTPAPDIFARGFDKGMSISSAAHTGLSINAADGATTQIHMGVNGVSLFQLLSAAGYSGITNTAHAAIVFGTDSTERMRLTESGSLGVGTPYPDIFGVGYDRSIGIRSTIGRAGLALDAGPSNASFVNFGSGGTMVGQIFAFTDQFSLSSIGSTPLSFGAGGQEYARLYNSFFNLYLPTRAFKHMSLYGPTAEDRILGYAADSEKYAFDSGVVPHYGMSVAQPFGWMAGNAGTAIGGYGGIDFHTASTSRMKLNTGGQLILSTSNPPFPTSYLLTINGGGQAYNWYTVPSDHASVGGGSVSFSVPYSGDNFVIGGRTGSSFATLWGWLGPNQNYTYIGQEWRIGGIGGYTGIYYGQMISARNDSIASYHTFANVSNNWSLKTGTGDNSFHIIDNQFGAYYVSCMGGKVGIRTPSPKGILSIVGAEAPTTPQTVNSFFIGESSNHPDYHFKQGMYYDGGAWSSAIDSIAGAIGAALWINPTGGPVYFGGSVNFTQPVPISSGGTSANTQLQAYLNLVAKARNYGKPGYLKLTDDFFVQWGEGTIAGNTTGTISFPVAFANFAVCIVSGGSSATGVEGSIRRYGSTSITGQTIANSGADSATYGWIAIGV